MAGNRISVVVCTHNPRPDYFARVLEALRRQALPPSAWELVIVDNGSDTVLADQVDLGWHPRGRHVREDRVGLIDARLRGLAEATGDLVVFVDDDNVLAPEYLNQAATLASRQPDLGVFGAGRLEAEFEAPPPAGVRSRLNMIGVRSIESPLFGRDPLDHARLPCGAGLVVTRPVAVAYDALVARLGVREVVGRRAERLFSGDDDLFAWAAAELGLGFGLSPDLRLTHLIRAERVTARYFVRLIRDHAFSHTVLRHLLGVADSRPKGLLPYARLAAHAFVHGTLSARCQWGELRGEREARGFIRQRHLRPLGRDRASWTTQKGNA